MNKEIKKFITGLKRIQTDDLYIALIGDIDAHVISDTEYINNGEYAYYYTIVKEEDGSYYSIMDNRKYQFRDESKFPTILWMSTMSSEERISVNQAQKIIDEFNKNIKDKEADNKVYIRKIELDREKSNYERIHKKR